jgi:hypothetical protein
MNQVLVIKDAAWRTEVTMVKLGLRW